MLFSEINLILRYLKQGIYYQWTPVIANEQNYEQNAWSNTTLQYYLSLYKFLTKLVFCSMRYHAKYKICTKIWPFDLSYPEKRIFGIMTLKSVWSLYLTLTFKKKFKKKVTNGFWEILKNVNFWAKNDLLTSFPGQQEFSKKSGFVTFVHLWPCNFMQKIRKN